MKIVLGILSLIVATFFATGCASPTPKEPTSIDQGEVAQSSTKIVAEKVTPNLQRRLQIQLKLLKDQEISSLMTLIES